MLRPALITSSTSSSCEAMMGLHHRAKLVRNHKMNESLLFGQLGWDKAHTRSWWFGASPSSCRRCLQSQDQPVPQSCGSVQRPTHDHARSVEDISRYISNFLLMPKLKVWHGGWTTKKGITSIATITSWVSKPEFSASVLGITSRASANAVTPSCARCCY